MSADLTLIAVESSGVKSGDLQAESIKCSTFCQTFDLISIWFEWSLTFESPHLLIDKCLLLPQNTKKKKTTGREKTNTHAAFPH